MMSSFCVVLKLGFAHDGSLAMTTEEVSDANQSVLATLPSIEQ